MGAASAQHQLLLPGRLAAGSTYTIPPFIHHPSPFHVLRPPQIIMSALILVKGRRPQWLPHMTNGIDNNFESDENR